MALKVSVTARDKSVFVVFVSGSIDTNTYTVLEKELAVLLAKSPKVVVIDMKDVPYISSMGLSTILKSKKDLEKQGGTFLMVNLQPQVKKLVAVEIDKRFFENIQKQFEQAKNFQLVQGDFLKQDLFAFEPGFRILARIPDIVSNYR